MNNALEIFYDHWNYWIFIVLMMIGFYVVIARGNLIKKLVGLNIFQTSVFLFYISMSTVEGGTAPILVNPDVEGAAAVVYSNPLPHVLILTAIVVGVATTAVGLALAIRVKETYGTVEEDEIIDQDREGDVVEAARRERLANRGDAEAEEQHS